MTSYHVRPRIVRQLSLAIHGWAGLLERGWHNARARGGRPMKAAVLHELGGVPRYEEFAEPVAGADEVLVRVQAAALKPIDRQFARGSHYASPRELPVVCGMDGVGKLEDGSRVFFAAGRRAFGAVAGKR